MTNYTSQNQLAIFDFRLDFESKLNPKNRWVKLSKLLDWDKLAEVYGKQMSSNMGARGIDARIVIGALIIKHIERKDDRGTIEMIQENPYMQYFLGFDHFTDEPVFNPSLFVHIRKRLGNESFEKMNDVILFKALEINEKINQSEQKSQNKAPNSEQKEDREQEQANPSGTIENKGKLQLDATVCDAHIKYPTDLGLLNDAREKSEELINLFCKRFSLPKPRTYRIVARKSWLNLSKKKRKSHKEIRKGVGQQLNFLKRNLKFLNQTIGANPFIMSELTNNQYKYLLVIQELERQQREMYVEKKHTIEDRIVSIHQPHVRPIVRGKSGKTVEFGAKINVSLQMGYARINQFNFNPFNESIYLREQVEDYKKFHGYYPELVQSDDIYMTRENRKYLKENNIRHTGRPLGRKPKEELSKAEKKKKTQEKNERNHIEGKFGQGKGKYGLNKIMAKLASTSESWIASILFVMNILRLSKDILCPIFKPSDWRIIFGIFLKLTPKPKPNLNPKLWAT